MLAERAEWESQMVGRGVPAAPGGLLWDFDAFWAVIVCLVLVVAGAF